MYVSIFYAVSNALSQQRFCLRSLSSVYTERLSRDYANEYATLTPGSSPRRFSKWQIVGRRPWQRLGHVVQNLKKSWRFLSHDILRKTKTKWQRSIAWEAKHRSKNTLTLYTRQWWLCSEIKYYFNTFLFWSWTFQHL